ncbi:hypothetical protein [Aquihabitans sp. G128]
MAAAVVLVASGEGAAGGGLIGGALAMAANLAVQRRRASRA